MIVFDLECRPAGHRFEGWFGSSGDFAQQQERGLIACPHCGAAEVAKAPMAPAVSRKGNQIALRPSTTSVEAPSEGPTPAPEHAPAQAIAGAMPPEARKMMRTLAKMQAKALEDSRWVGGKFADEARAMHYGEREVETIHGETTLAEAQDLIEEGVAVAPLPFRVVPPGEAN